MGDKMDHTAIRPSNPPRRRLIVGEEVNNNFRQPPKKGRLKATQRRNRLPSQRAVQPTTTSNDLLSGIAALPPLRVGYFASGLFVS